MRFCRHELAVLQNVPNHRNLLNLLGICLDFDFEGQTTLCIVVPLKQGGSMHSFVRKRGACFRWLCCASVLDLCGILTAVLYDVLCAYFVCGFVFKTPGCRDIHFCVPFACWRVLCWAQNPRQTLSSESLLPFTRIYYGLFLSSIIRAMRLLAEVVVLRELGSICIFFVLFCHVLFVLFCVLLYC